ncbi:MAG: XVIPCD domain-containing protein [Lysobacteraceae bacterium]
MSESPTLVAQNTPPPRSTAPSFVPDEWGGSDLANPEWSRLDYQAARANVQLIRQSVQSRGGDPDETAALVGGALRQVSERAPFGHVGNAFLYGATQVLLERANAMSPADFNQYLRTLDQRQNPLNLFERTPLDALTEASKQATVRHLEQTGGQQSFRLFGAMEGQNGPLAFSAGAADAVAENYGRGARDLLTIAANPLEAGRQFTNLAGSIGQLPQAVQEAYRQLQTEIGRWGESDYRKGYITGQAVITALDVRDTVESVGRLGALATELRAGRIHGIGDALEVLEHGRPRNRGSETPDAPGPPRQVEPSSGSRTRVPDPTPVVDPVATPAGRQSLPDATQARLISGAFGFEGAMARELDGEILRWAQGRPGNAIENLRNSPEVLYGRGNGDIGLIGNAYLRAADIPDADLPAARRALGEIRDAMGGRSGADYARLYDDLMVPGSQSRRYFDGLVEHARDELRVEGIRERSVANAVVIDAAGQPQQVYATARRPETVELQTGNERFVAEIRTATTGGGQQYVGWGTNDRWYPFLDSDRVFNADGSINRERAAQAIMNDLNTGSAQRDALLPYDAWQQRRIEEQRLGSVGNAVIIDANGDPRRIVATAGSGEAVEIVGADRQRRMIEIRDGQTADGQRYLGFGTNEQWYPFPADRPVQRADGSLDIAVARDYITAQARAGNINRNAMVPGDQWDATHGRIGNDGLDQALQPLPQGVPRDRVQEAPTPGQRNDTPAPTPDRTPPVETSQTPPQAQRTPPPDATDRTPGQTDEGGQRQLPPSSQPNDPLLPFHAIERDQRMRAPEPLVAPGGQRFDVMGIDEDGRLRLRPEGQRVGALPAEAMFEMRPSTPQTLAQPGNAVTYGREPWLTAGRNEQGIVLRDPQNAERTVVVPEARAAEIATPVGREVTYQGETWRFQALQSPGWQPGVERRGFQLVDPGNPERTVFVPENRAVDIRMRLGEDGDYRFGDVRHGVIRLNPMDGGREITMPLAPGMTFEARLRDRELEGPYRITVGNDGELTATGRIRNGNEVIQRIEPSDIAPRYVEVRSPDFNDRFEVDSFVAREANLRNRAIATEPTGLPLRDPAFGNLDGTPSPQLALGTQSLETQADFIRRNAGNLAPGQTPSLTVFNIAFSNEGEARQVLDAMSEFRRLHGDAAQIRIVAYEPSFRSFEGTPAFRELQEVIRRDRIEVDFFGNDPSQREVIHAKGVAVNDQVLFSTGAVIDASRNKADISVQLPPDAARAFNAYLDEAVIGNAGVDRRQQLAADAAREGVLINDPEARLPYIARAQDGLIRGAQRELTVSVSELRNPETTRAIIERADAGVNVQVQFREMDPESRRLLAEAQQRLPNLAVEDVSAWQPRPHYNVIVADRQQAYVGTAYLWQNQQDMLQHGRSFENGVLLQGDAVQRLQAQMEALRSLQPAHPGQRLLNPASPDAPDVGVRVNGQTTGSISVSAPPGSSIGVDVRDSTVNGSIQTVSGSGNVQVSGHRETLGTAATAAPDGNGNVQVTATPGLRVELQHPGTSGRTGTDVRIDDSTVNGSVQSIVGNDNMQVDVNAARVQGSNRQTVTGDDNRQTQNLGANVTTGSIQQTIDGRTGARQQIGDDLPAPRTPPADDRRSALPADTPGLARGPGLDDPRHPQHPMFASALERIQTYERDRGIDSGDFGRNVAGSLVASAVASGLPEIRHVVFNAEGTRAFAVDTPNLDAEWRRIAFVDVAGAGQQSLAASTERLRESQVQAASQAVASPQPQVRPEEQRSGARMA